MWRVPEMGHYVLTSYNTHTSCTIVPLSVLFKQDIANIVMGIKLNCTCTDMMTLPYMTCRHYYLPYNICPKRQQIKKV